MPLAHDPAGQIAPDQAQQTLILYPTRHPRHQHIVVDSVKELLQIQVHNLAFAGVDIALGCSDRLSRTASGPKPIAVR